MMEPDMDSRGKTTRTWVWRSSARSVANGQISALAITETVLACTAFSWIASEWGGSHFFLSALIAPLLLLRTPDSTALGVALFAKMVDAISTPLAWIEESPEATVPYLGNLILKSIVLPLVFSLTLVSSLLAKCAATTYICLRSPLVTLSYIPANWASFILSVDSSSPRLLIPGVTQSHATAFEVSKPDELIIHALNVIRKRRPLKHWSDLLAIASIVMCGVVPVICFIWIPAMMYRWSIKGTAWIYLPLLWISHTSSSGTIFSRLRDMRYMLIYKIAAALGAGACALLVARWALPHIWLDVCSWLKEHAPLLAEFIQPTGPTNIVPKWQVASAINGALAVALFLFADWAVQLKADGRSIRESIWSPILRTVWPIRTTLSTYSIAANIYTAASLVEHYGLPKIGGKWFPWS